jgi:hypothetical protein
LHSCDNWFDEQACGFDEVGLLVSPVIAILGPAMFCAVSALRSASTLAQRRDALLSPFPVSFIDISHANP